MKRCRDQILPRKEKISAVLLTCPAPLFISLSGTRGASNLCETLIHTNHSFDLPWTCLLDGSDPAGSNEPSDHNTSLLWAGCRASNNDIIVSDRGGMPMPSYY